MTTIHSEAMLFIELYEWYTAEAGWRLIYALWRHETDPGYWKNAILSDGNPNKIAFFLAWGFLMSAGTCAYSSLQPASAVVATASSTTN